MTNNTYFAQTSQNELSDEYLEQLASGRASGDRLPLGMMEGLHGMGGAEAPAGLHGLLYKTVLNEKAKRRGFISKLASCAAAMVICLSIGTVSFASAGSNAAPEMPALSTSIYNGGSSAEKTDMSLPEKAPEDALSPETDENGEVVMHLSDPKEKSPGKYGSAAKEEAPAKSAAQSLPMDAPSASGLPTLGVVMLACSVLLACAMVVISIQYKKQTQG